MLSQFLRLLEQSVIVSGLLAAGVSGAVIYLAIVGRPIPDLLANSMLIIIGFFFGGKVQAAEQRISNSLASFRRPPEVVDGEK